MKVLIINRNRLTLPVKLADWCAARGLEPWFIDNASDYPPLLEYYANSPYPVLRLLENYGHTVPWMFDGRVLDMCGVNGPYIVTDPDIDFAGVPDDFLSVMEEGLNRHKQFDKCALSLEIEDLPDSNEGRFIRKHEAKYWLNPLDDKYYQADTDTTFAMYREGVRHYSHSAIRTMRPYTARHVPWYYTDFNSLPEDEQYYFRTANASSSGKARLLP